ncbi:MAG: type II toxin-antitoxin system Phd/YefM family antitoxin [Fimbriimonas sp.]
MIHANVADVKARLSHFLRLAKAGERVMICDRNKPVAELVPVREPIDKALRASAFGMFKPVMTDEEMHEALRPMTDEEADAFIEGHY